MKKKVLIVDDSALTRRVFCDIINADDRFEVADMATDGAEGFKYVVSRTYDAVVLDVYMPKMTGLQMLQEMQNSSVSANVLMASTTTREGARETLTALELGALDFITKPEYVVDARNEAFKEGFIRQLWTVANATAGSRRTQTSLLTQKKRTFEARVDVNIHKLPEKELRQKKTATAPVRATDVSLRKRESKRTGSKIVAIASSTGGPRALHSVLPKLPKNIDAPILLVQHMPKGFTSSLAERFDEICEIPVQEAKENTRIEKGHVYIAQGGTHLKVVQINGLSYLRCTDDPFREGVKPCANYMYESLAESPFDEVVCVVLTGMGSDGTEGIQTLTDQKHTFVIAQDESTSAVYGMPKSIAATGLVNEILPLEEVADTIIKEVGVR